MKKILLLVLLCIGFNQLNAIKPTQIYVSETGNLDQLYFSLENEPDLYPLRGLEIAGNGQVNVLEVLIGNSIVQFDEFGVPFQSVLQGRFKIQYNFNRKIERIKDINNRLIMKLEYDYNGRLVKIKDGNFDVRFKMYYDHSGRLSAIANGDYDKLLRFYYNLDNCISGIKDEDFDYEYRFYYGWSKELEKIKSDDFDVLAKFIYDRQRVTHIETYNLYSEVIIGQPNYQNNPGNYPQCQPNQPVNQARVSVFYYTHFGDVRMQLNQGNYATLGNEWNNRISVIEVPSNMKVVVYEHSNFGGACKTITGRWVAGPHDFWRNRIGSIKIMYI